MIKTFEKETVLQFRVLPPLHLPFYNEGNQNAYYKYEAFDMDPFTVCAGPTSGSPVILTETGFYGFMNESGGRFVYDGCGTLSIHCPAGQVLYFNEDCNPYAEWQEYNRLILQSFPEQKNEDFWGVIEYCTWVEQKKAGRMQGMAREQDSLCEQLVYDYMKRVDQMKLPRGKLTIDDGWDFRCGPDGRRIFGNWEINRKKFPHMEKLVRDMKEEGFIPGLWFSPFLFTTDSDLALKHPELQGNTWAKDEKTGFHWRFIRPSRELEDYYTKIFTYYVDMGFRKFKLDIAYDNKAEMKILLEMMYKIIKKLDPTIEVECHIPDIFASRYCDTVRMNDVNFDDKGIWRQVTMEHYKTCRFSSPHKILNLDHLGTNTPIPKVELFLEHTKMLLALDGGYPCVSLLPDLFGKAATDIYVNAVREWKERQKATLR